MPVFTFPVDPVLARQYEMVIRRRLADYLTRKGYVLGQGSVQVPHDGRILVDADRTPAADMPAFDYTQPTPDEQVDLDLRAQVSQALVTLDANRAELSDLTAWGALTTAAKAEMLRKDVNDATVTLARLIRYFKRRDL